MPLQAAPSLCSAASLSLAPAPAAEWGPSRQVSPGLGGAGAGAVSARTEEGGIVLGGRPNLLPGPQASRGACPPPTPGKPHPPRGAARSLTRYWAPGHCILRSGAGRGTGSRRSARGGGARGRETQRPEETQRRPAAAFQSHGLDPGRHLSALAPPRSSHLFAGVPPFSRALGLHQLGGGT